MRGWIFFPLRIEFETRNLAIEGSILFVIMNQFQTQIVNYWSEVGKLLVITKNQDQQEIWSNLNSNVSQCLEKPCSFLFKPIKIEGKNNEYKILICSQVAVTMDNVPALTLTTSSDSTRILFWGVREYFFQSLPRFCC